jgi:hypothetical protein
MSAVRAAMRSTHARRRFGIVLTVAAVATATGLLTGSHNTPEAGAKPINPYVPCPQWQQMHPDWPCWGNFPEIEEPTIPVLPPAPPLPALPTPQPSTLMTPPSTTPVTPPAAALTPPPPLPAPDPCKAIVPVPGYTPPALPGHLPNQPCSSGTPNPRKLLEPYLQPTCGMVGLRVLSPDQVHEVVTRIVGPSRRNSGRTTRMYAGSSMRSTTSTRPASVTRVRWRRRRSGTTPATSGIGITETGSWSVIHKPVSIIGCCTICLVPRRSV